MSGQRMRKNNYRETIAALILLFNPEQSPTLFPTENSNQLNYNDKIMSTPENTLKMITNLSTSPLKKLVFNFDDVETKNDEITIRVDFDKEKWKPQVAVDIYLDYRISTSLYRIYGNENYDIHNKIVTQLYDRHKYPQIKAYRYAPEVSNAETYVRQSLARSAFENIWEEIKDSTDYLWAALRNYAISLSNNVVFDYGFKVYSKDADTLYWHSMICHCPLSSKGKPHRELNEDFILNPDSMCANDKDMTPHDLIKHFQMYKDKCVFHRILYDYMKSFYSIYWENERRDLNESLCHYALFDKETEEYDKALFSWNKYAPTSSISANVDLDLPKLNLRFEEQVNPKEETKKEREKTCVEVFKDYLVQSKPVELPLSKVASKVNITAPPSPKVTSEENITASPSPPKQMKDFWGSGMVNFNRVVDDQVKEVQLKEAQKVHQPVASLNKQPPSNGGHMIHPSRLQNYEASQSQSKTLAAKQVKQQADKEQRQSHKNYHDQLRNNSERIPQQRHEEDFARYGGHHNKKYNKPTELRFYGPPPVPSEKNKSFSSSPKIPNDVTIDSQGDVVMTDLSQTQPNKIVFEIDLDDSTTESNDRRTYSKKSSTNCGKNSKRCRSLSPNKSKKSSHKAKAMSLSPSKSNNQSRSGTSVMEEVRSKKLPSTATGVACRNTEDTQIADGSFLDTELISKMSANQNVVNLLSNLNDIMQKGGKSKNKLLRLLNLNDDQDLDQTERTLIGPMAKKGVSTLTPADVQSSSRKSLERLKQKGSNNTPTSLQKKVKKKSEVISSCT